MDIPAVDVATHQSTRADPGGAARRTVVVVTARFFDSVVEERFLAHSGRVVQIGNSPAMDVPVPPGMPWLAKIRWVGQNRWIIEDPQGHQYPLEPGDVHSITAGPVAIEFRVVGRSWLRRWEGFALWGSFAWFTVVFAATIVSMQGEIVARNTCPWFGLFCPEIQMAQGGSSVSAEYLARLLREDYAGAEDGGIEPEEHETDENKGDWPYIPAGAEGPITEMGGAEQVADQEIRAPEATDPAAAETSAEEPVVATAEGIEEVPVIEPSEDDRNARAVTGGEEEEEVVESDGPAEDHTGWGVQDWYDADDKAEEQFEIQYMLKEATQRLRIDPNDPDALSILSYYQYLAQDYEGAEKTYDKFIGLFPEESAGYNNKALIYKRKGDYAKEEGLYRVALALDPDDEVVLNNLAVCVAHQGRFAEAKAIMDRLEVLDPGDPYADLHRSKIAAAMGDDEQAYQYLEKALQGMAALDTLHHIEFRQDIRLDPAFEHLRQTRRFHAILTRYYGEDSPLQEGG